jgi:hypothetical protein
MSAAGDIAVGIVGLGLSFGFAYAVARLVPNRVIVTGPMVPASSPTTAPDQWAAALNDYAGDGAYGGYPSGSINAGLYAGN